MFSYANFKIRPKRILSFTSRFEEQSFPTTAKTQAAPLLPSPLPLSGQNCRFLAQHTVAKIKDHMSRSPPFPQSRVCS